MCVCVWCVCVCVCVHVCERERERERWCVCVCVYMCERERERERGRKRARERERCDWAQVRMRAPNRNLYEHHNYFWKCTFMLLFFCFCFYVFSFLPYLCSLFLPLVVFPSFFSVEEVGRGKGKWGEGRESGGWRREREAEVEGGVSP